MTKRHARMATGYWQILGLIVAWCTLVPAYGDPAAQDLGAQRNVFINAQTAVIAGKTKTFKALLPKLETYPLYGYLLFEDLSRRLPAATETEMQAFFKRTAAQRRSCTALSQVPGPAR